MADKLLVMTSFNELWNFRSRVLSLPGAKVHFRSLELSFPGTFAPESENDVARELSLPLCKICISCRHTHFA